MKLNEYAQWTENTCAKLENPQLDDFHMLMGMATETAEIFDIYKKHLAYKKELDMIHVQEEIGDLIFYIASFCRMNNLDLEKIIETNVKKLESRYPEKFTEHNAIHRNLNKERKVLEK